MKPILFPNDAQFWYETLRMLGHSSYGGSEFGEVVTTAQRITPGNYDSWYEQWFRTASKVRAEAQAALDAGHLVSARDGFLRASNYFRSADFFLHGKPEDPRIIETHQQSKAAFRAAARLLSPAIETVQIPYEGVTLEGYFYSGGSGQRPTVIMHNGFDGSCEEMHFFGAAAAQERGYNVLTFDGPGQPSAKLNHGLAFRHDWENVITPVFDWLIATYAQVDASRVALLGLSMGGVLAPRAAAFEHRLAAVIAVDGVYDLGEVSTARSPLPRGKAEEQLRAAEAPELDAALASAMASGGTARWGFEQGMYSMNVASPRQFLAKYLDYTLTNGLAEQITCPTLVCDAEDDLFFSGQPDQLFDHLTSQKAMLRFTNEEGAGAHCHTGAQRLAFGRIFDWLDDILQTIDGQLQHSAGRVRATTGG